MTIGRRNNTPANLGGALVIDINHDENALIASYLSEMGYEVVSIESDDNLDEAKTADIKLVVLSIDVDTALGLSVIEKCKLQNRDCVVLVTGNLLDPETILAAMNAGADDYLVKPFNKISFMMRLRSLASRKNI